MSLDKKLYIDGQLIDGSETFDVVSPASGEIVGTIAGAGEVEVQAALISAENALATWGSCSVEERIEWMQRLRTAVIANEDHLRECIHLEMGKTWAGTQEDYDSLVNSLEYYAQEIGRFAPEALPDREGTHNHTISYEPAGVAVALLAWNFPLLNLAFKIGPAMAAGCPIIIKPSLSSPLSAYAVGELCAEIGLPKGVVNIVCGNSGYLGNALASSKIPALLTLIGSTETGRHIIEKGATSIKRYSMELGGNAPVLVFADADLDLAADIVCAVKFGNTGQICVTPNRVFVEDSVADEFRQRVVARATKTKIGHDRHEDIDMGPLIDHRAWERVDGLVKSAVADGAEILAGGKRPEGLSSGHYYEPTVVAGVTPEMKIYKEEIFGPVVSLIQFSDEDAVIKLANDTDAGLTAYVFTKDPDKANRCAKRLRFGEIQINGVKYAIYLPHVGMKQSGVGCDCSYFALHDYLVPKRITSAII